MKISVIVPVYNEEKTIKNVIDRIQRVAIDKEIIIVDDCSKDGTHEVLKAIQKEYPQIKVVYSNPNRGKGYAIKYGFKFATGDVVIIQDADLEYNPEDYLKIAERYIKENADIVYGSRFRGKCENMSFFQIFANKFFNFLTNMIHGSRLTDTCTCYKSFKADVIKNLPLDSDGFEICHEINAKLLKRRYNIIEVPIDYHARTWKEGKKVGCKVFFTSTAAILKYGFSRK